MTLSSNVSRWLKVAALLSSLAALVALMAWLGGSVFMAWVGYKFEDASITTLYQYWFHYGDQADIRTKLLWSSLIGIAIVIIPILAIILTPSKRSLFGESRLATLSDINKSDLIGTNEGIILGVKTYFFGIFQRIIYLSGHVHALLYAPTRSGKGVSVVIPNALAWKGSLVALDMKGEIWDTTAGFRQAHGQECYLVSFAPRDLKTWGWNPLFYISNDPHFRIDDIQKIGQMLFPNVQSESPIWQASSRALWLGLVLLLMETKGSVVSLGEVARQLSQGDERLKNLVKERQESDNPLSEECYLSLFDYLETPEKTRGGVRRSFLSALELFTNPVIDAATSHNDFDFADLRKKPMSIYLAVPPDNLERLQPLINLFMQQFMDVNTRVRPEEDPTIKHEVLLLADEFKAFGKVPAIANGISYFGGYWIRLLTIIQSPSQIRSVYGADDADTFFQNHAAQCVFAPKDIKIAKEISENIGTTTVKSKSRTTPLMSLSNKGKSENSSDTGRAVLLPQEVKNIGRKNTIIFIEDCPPILARKLVWYEHPIFSKWGNNLVAKIYPYPAPVPPTVKIRSLKGTVDFSGISKTKEKAGGAVTIVERPITAADVDKLDDMSLADFSCDFSQIEIPQGQLDDKQMDDLTRQFFEGLAA
ncbi:MAG: Protein VirD4 [Bacteroides sp.]